MRRKASGSFPVVLVRVHEWLLPRNPELADWLIAAALHYRYGDASAELIARPVPDGVDAFAHQAMDALRLRPQ